MWDAAEKEVTKVELLDEMEARIWMGSIKGSTPYEKVKELVNRWSKLRAQPAKAKRWYDKEVKELGKEVRKLARGPTRLKLFSLVLFLVMFCFRHSLYLLFCSIHRLNQSRMVRTIHRSPIHRSGTCNASRTIR